MKLQAGLAVGSYRSAGPPLSLPPLGAHGWPVSSPWLGGRIALIVAAVGLLVAVLSGVWLVHGARSAAGTAGGTSVVDLLAASPIVIGLLMLVGGLGYYVLAPAFIGGAMAWRGVGSHRLTIASTGLVVLLTSIPILVYAVVAGLPADLRCTAPGFLAGVSPFLALLAVAYLRFIRPGVVTATDLGLATGHLSNRIGLGVLIGGGVLLLNFASVQALAVFGVQQTQAAELACLRDLPLAGVLATVLTAGLFGPIAEEAYFRGVVFRNYLRTRSLPMAYGATTALFAALHFNLPLLLGSLVLCHAYRRTGSIVAHVVNNIVLFGLLYLTNLLV